MLALATLGVVSMIFSSVKWGEIMGVFLPVVLFFQRASASSPLSRSIFFLCCHHYFLLLLCYHYFLLPLLIFHADFCDTHNETR